MIIDGIISKMVVAHTTPVSYSLPLSESLVPLNAFLNKKISLEFLKSIVCQGCHQAIKKVYQPGYCFNCVKKLARCDLCIVRPERCHFHLGTCREKEWAQIHCMAPHIVYLANVTGVNVGITRFTQMPVRWIDQGAVCALPLFEVPSRYLSGLIEILLAKNISSRANWRQLLMTDPSPVDLKAFSISFLENNHKALEDLKSRYRLNDIKFLKTHDVVNIKYPIIQYPTKIVSLSFDKSKLIEGTLLGIKGQYLIFDTGVLNIRKFSGYSIRFSD